LKRWSDTDLPGQLVGVVSLTRGSLCEPDSVSIWANLEHIGTDDRVHGYPPNNRGAVLSYAVGFSNHYPEVGGNYEQPSSVVLSSIPAWCVPGHAGSEDFGVSGPWIRLDVNTHEHDEHGQPTGARKHASVVIDVEAARSLAQDLLEWADGRHVYPP
jgi:hypothetical protein